MPKIKKGTFLFESKKYCFPVSNLVWCDGVVSESLTFDIQPPPFSKILTTCPFSSFFGQNKKMDHTKRYMLRQACVKVF